jgi:hypothetical protein
VGPHKPSSKRICNVAATFKINKQFKIIQNELKSLEHTISNNDLRHYKHRKAKDVTQDKPTLYIILHDI